MLCETELKNPWKRDWTDIVNERLENNVGLQIELALIDCQVERACFDI